MTALAIRVLRAFAAALGQPENAFEPIYTPSPNQLIKLIRYPGRERGEGDQGVGAHKDSGFVTILLQDKVAGLQVEGPNGWIDAPPKPGTFVVNIGEILELASNGYLQSHRPSRGVAAAGRRSALVAFFLGARLDATVPVLKLARRIGRGGAWRDAGPAQSALPRSRPELPQGPVALASRRRAPPLRRSHRGQRKSATKKSRCLLNSTPGDFCK